MDCAWCRVDNSMLLRRNGVTTRLVVAFLYMYLGARLAHPAAFGVRINAASDAESCRCALLYSGHVRSFAQPRVHLTHKENLIKQLEVDCQVDVFLYLSGAEAQSG